MHTFKKSDVVCIKGSKTPYTVEDVGPMHVKMRDDAGVAHFKNPDALELATCMIHIFGERADLYNEYGELEATFYRNGKMKAVIFCNSLGMKYQFEG